MATKCGCGPKRECYSVDRRKQKKLTIERIKSSATVGGDGHIDKSAAASWETYITIRAVPTTKGGKEIDDDNVTTATRRSVWETRYSKTVAGITSEMRAKLSYNGGTRTLNIEAVEDVDYAGEVIRIYCTENTDG